LVQQKEVLVLATDLKRGEIVVCEAGDIIPADGDVIEGIASVDESAITGESAPVIRESGGDRSAVTGGTKVISDRSSTAYCLDRSSVRRPNEIALMFYYPGLTVIFLLVVISMPGLVTAEHQACQDSKIWLCRFNIPAGMSYSNHYWWSADSHRHKRNGQIITQKCHCNQW
jgi:K+-transporting ATPase ATPase B chain